MKKLILIMMFLCLGLSSQAQNWCRVIHAIAKVESNYNPNAVNGVHAGYLQISPVLVQDCNRIMNMRGSKKRFSLKDRYSKEKSIEMFHIIQSYYNPNNNTEKAIRLWNGGPNYSVRSTQNYYNKVKKYLSLEDE